jgi:type IV pilus assembly protein PilE
MRMQSGVTLIELMMVVVILGILAAISVPSYRQYLLRANRTDATSALMNLQVAQEKFYLQNNVYTDKIKDAPPTGLGMTDVTSHGYYQLKVTLADGTAQAYTATATPITGKGQSDDKKCLEYSITDAGKRGATGSLGTIPCWQ